MAQDAQQDWPLVLMKAVSDVVEAFEWGGTTFDDEFDGGVAELLFSIQSVAYGDEIVAIEFDVALGAVLAGAQGLHNVHIVLRWGRGVLQSASSHGLGSIRGETTRPARGGPGLVSRCQEEHQS